MLVRCYPSLTVQCLVAVAEHCYILRIYPSKPTGEKWSLLSSSFKIFDYILQYHITFSHIRQTANIVTYYETATMPMYMTFHHCCKELSTTMKQKRVLRSSNILSGLKICFLLECVTEEIDLQEFSLSRKFIKQK